MNKILTLFLMMMASCISAQTDKIQLKANGYSFTATLEQSPAAAAFAALLPRTLNMNELNGNEKYFYLAESLPTSEVRPGTIREGDIMLYGSSCIVVFYKTFSSSYSYTRIGHIEDVTNLQQALGAGSVSVTFELTDAASIQHPHASTDTAAEYALSGIKAQENNARGVIIVQSGKKKQR